RLGELLAECGYAMRDRSLDDLPTRRVAWLAPATLQARDRHDLTQRRIGVVHPDPGAADALAEALRARGARVIVLSLGAAGLERAEALDPDVVLVPTEHFARGGRSVVAALWEHLWLCWTPILFVPAERLGIAAASAPDVRELAVGIQTLCADYELALRRARRKEPFQLRLEQLGPVRTLRALLDSQSSLRVRIETSQRTYELDVGEGLVIGASAVPQQGAHREELLGVNALKLLLASTGGQVSIRSVAQPALTNIMAPLEALLLSERELPPLADIPQQRERAPHALAAGADQSIPVAAPARFLRIPPHNSADTPSVAACSEPRTATSPSAPPDNDTTTPFTCPTPPPPPPTHDVAVLVGSVEETVRELGALEPEPLPLWSKLLHEARRRLPRGSSSRVAVAGVVAATAAAAVTMWLASDALSARPPSRPPRIVSSAQLNAEAKPSPQREPRSDDQGPTEVRGEGAEQQAPSSAEDELVQQYAGNDPRQQAAELASSLVRKGNKLRRRGRLRAAHDAYRDALEAFPRFPRALFGLTEIAVAQGDAAKALDRVGHLLQERHRFPDDQRLLGDVYMLAGRTDEAQAAWRRGARMGSSVARARLRALKR
ncbi:MAG TPA: hypothetical protein VJU61_13930, partial [Polyangiaceae bacterium]|nr:hypothetical protein [Polyangiaceae bacterium]